MGEAVLEEPGEAHALHELLDALLHLLLGHVQDAVLVVDPHGLGDDVTGSHARIQRGVGILEHHLHALAGGDQILVLQLREVLAIEFHFARRRPVKLGHGSRGGGFAATGFTYEPEGLALLELEVDAIDSVDGALLSAHEAAPEGEVHLEFIDFQQGIVLGHGYFSSEYSQQPTVRPLSNVFQAGYFRLQMSIALSQRG